MKFYLIAMLFLLLLLSGCVSQGVSSQASLTEASIVANVTDDSYLNAYKPWQLVKAKEAGVSEYILRHNAIQSHGRLESRIREGLCVPPQSLMDNLLIDAFFIDGDAYMDIQNETAVLLTEQRGDTYYSYLSSSTIEYGGDAVAIWEKNGEDIHIVDRIGIEILSSLAVNPILAEHAGDYFMASALGTQQLYGDEPAVAVQCGIFSVEMKDGTVIAKDVKGQSCFILFLPDDEIGSWSLKDIDGELLWDSEQSLWKR